MRIDKRNIANIYSLTALQQGILFHYLHNNKSKVYAELLSFRIENKVDIEVMKKAWEFVNQENEVLRTVFKWKKIKQPLQIVLKKKPVDFRSHDLSHIDMGKKIQQLDNIKDEEIEAGFNLEENCFRIVLCKMSEEEYELMIINHHIILDGWSTTNIIRQFIQIYNQMKNGINPEKKSQIKYIDYIKKINAVDNSKANKFWNDYFIDYELPLVDSRRNHNALKSIEKISLSKEVSQKLEEYLKENKLTLANVINTIFGYILARYSGNNSSLIGTVVSGRNIDLDGINEVAGLFINTLPLKVDFNKGEKILDVINKVKNHMIDRSPYEHTSLMELKEILKINEYNEIFDTLIVIENYPFDEKVKNSEFLKITDIDVREENNYNLTVTVVKGEKIEVSLTYNTSLYTCHKIKRMCGHLKTLIDNISTKHEILIEDIEMLTKEERKQILLEFNRIAKDSKQHFIINEYNQLQPVGIAGELCVLKEEIDDIFNDTYISEDSIIRSGELAKWLPNGDIVMLGRVEEQVKLRGHRVDLKEIESELLKTDMVKKALVTAVEDYNKEKKIVVYVISDDKLSEKAIKEELLKTLPEYIIPSYFVQIDKIPVLDNGFVDFKSLPKPKDLTKPKKTLVITSTFTSEPVKEYIKWWCNEHDNKVEIKFAPYNQVFQELFNTESLTSKNKDVNIFMIRFEDWIRDINLSDDEMCSLIKENYEKLIEAIENMNSDGVSIFAVFPLSDYLGLSEKVKNYIDNLTQNFAQFVENNKSLLLLDFSIAEELYSVKEVFDPVKDKVGHMPFSDEYYAVMGTMIARKVCSLNRKPFKVIAVDCDNTLWSGVVGEDGVHGIEINESHIYLQNLLIKKQNEGMLIALCSKNNERDVWEVFEKNSNMVLKKEHIACWKINWQSKSKNLKELAQELNLGIDSFIFLDDSGVECYDVMLHNPEILTLQVPKDSKELPMFLDHIWAFDKDKVTEEDKVRTKRYQAERRRKEIKANTNKLEDFLNELKLKVYINEGKVTQIPRISQLTQRTNQFNLSTIRRTEEDIKTLMNDLNVKCWALEVEDRFGYYGLTGVVIMVKQGEKMFIDTLLLSCRVLGRKVEDALFAELCKLCYEQGIKRLETDFYPTAKNAMVEEYLVRVGWKKIKGDDSHTKYGVEIKPDMMTVDFVEVSHGEREVKEEAIAITEEKKSTNQNVNKSNTKKIKERTKCKVETANWKIELHNEDKLIHKSHTLSLKYYTGEQLLKLPVYIGEEYVAVTKDYEAPRNEIEEKLTLIWKEVLAIERVGVNDNFFDLGGQSLKATALVSRIHKEFDVEIPLTKIFDLRTIKELAKEVVSSEKNIYDSIEQVEEKEYYPMSFAQQRMYVLNQMNKEATTYNMPFVGSIKGSFDLERINNSFTKLVARHESLRTSFMIINNEMVQKIRRVSEVDFKIDFEDIFQLTLEDHQKEKLIEDKIEKFIRPFDLKDDLLFRVKVMKVSTEDEEYILMVDMHHIISDGTSLKLIVEEFIKIYAGDKLEDLRIQYKDYSVWQNDLIKSGKIKSQEEYWLEQFKGDIPVLNLVTDFERPEEMSHKGDSKKFVLDKELTEGLRNIAKQSEATLYMVLLAAFNVLLQKQTGQEDIIIGSPIAGRPHNDLSKIVGLFVNTLAVRNQPKNNITFREFLETVKENSLRAYENQDMQFDALVEKLSIKVDTSKNPIFDVMFVLQNTGVDEVELELEGRKIVPYPKKEKLAKFDLTLQANEDKDEIHLELEYVTDLFKESTIEDMGNQFIKLLHMISTDIDIEIKNISLLSSDESEMIENQVEEIAKLSEESFTF